MPTSNVAVGSGSDSLVLKIAQDAWRGDAQYIVRVDGKQIGGTLTAKASHAAGETDTITVKGNWATGPHKVTVQFLNDGYGGTSSADRNLYVEGATFNGEAIAGANIDFRWQGGQDFLFRDSGVNSAVYWLQNVKPAEIIASRFDLFIIDAMRFNNQQSGFYTSAEVAGMKGGFADRTMLGYVSIGEAEDYRLYWQDAWDTRSPGWMGPVNPEWGSRLVKFWDPTWQKIVFDYVDRIMAAGFDGAFFDVVDVYRTDWIRSQNPNSAQAMTDFVKAISAHAKAKDPDFKIYVNNPGELLARRDYLAAIDGVLKEELYYYEGSLRSDAANKADRDLYKGAVAAGKPVIDVEYTSDPAVAAAVLERARKDGFVSYIANRDLDSLSYTSIGGPHMAADQLFA